MTTHVVGCFGRTVGYAEDGRPGQGNQLADAAAAGIALVQGGAEIVLVGTATRIDGDQPIFGTRPLRALPGTSDSAA